MNVRRLSRSTLVFPLPAPGVMARLLPPPAPGPSLAQPRLPPLAPRHLLRPRIKRLWLIFSERRNTASKRPARPPFRPMLLPASPRATPTLPVNQVSPSSPMLLQQQLLLLLHHLLVAVGLPLALVERSRPLLAQLLQLPQLLLYDLRALPTSSLLFLPSRLSQSQSLPVLASLTVATLPWTSSTSG